jgi:TPR repeat protein
MLPSSPFTPSSRRKPALLGAGCAVFFCTWLLGASVARADLDADFNRCRADILRIGDNPRTPWETYCLGLSYQFAINRARDSAKALATLRKAAAQDFPPAQATLGYMLSAARHGANR